jgi:hypothetical protein
MTNDQRQLPMTKADGPMQHRPLSGVAIAIVHWPIWQLHCEF